MKGTGTMVNVAAVIAAGLLGMLFRKGIKQRFQDILIQGIGVCVIFIGIAGALSGLLKVSDDGSLVSKGSLILIASVLVGSLIGEAVNIEGLLQRFGEWIKKKAKSQNDTKFVEGFVTASLTICIGAMAIVGSIEDGLTGDASMLYTKSVLDFVIVIVFASVYGKGVVFSAIPVAVLQGLVTCCAVFISPYLSDSIIAGISFVGSVLIFCVGANLCLDRKFKVANMLPSLLIVALITAFIK